MKERGRNVSPLQHPSGIECTEHAKYSDTACAYKARRPPTSVSMRFRPASLVTVMITAPVTAMSQGWVVARSGLGGAVTAVVSVRT
jgi:hypothetical protein